MQVIFVLGPTGAGKSTFVEHASVVNPKVGNIQVGKLLRAKYPPSYFKGQAAPEHTEREAWELFITRLKYLEETGMEIALVDGQPRTMAQAQKAVEQFPDASYIVLDAGVDARFRRISNRDTGQALELSKARLNGDLPALTEIIAFLNNKIVRYNTENEHPIDIAYRLFGAHSNG